MHKIRAPPFKRMALVDQMILQKLKEDALSGYNPTLKAAVAHKDQMEAVLMSPIETLRRSKGFLSDEQRLALLRANQYFLNQLLKQAGNKTAKVNERQEETDAAVDDAATRAEEVDEEDQFVEAEEGESQQESVGSNMKPIDVTVPPPGLQASYNIPAQYKRKFAELHSLISKNPSVISTSKAGELVVHGEVQPGTSYPHLIRELFQQTSSTASGLTRLAAALHSIGATPEMISSQRAKHAMARAVKLMSTTGSKLSPIDKPKAKAEVGTSAPQSGQGRKRRALSLSNTEQQQSPPGKRIQVLRLYV